MQRKFSHALAFLFATLCAGLCGGFSGCGHSDTAAPPAPAPSHDAALSDKGVTINGKLIPVPCNEKEITAALGDPSRKVDTSPTSVLYIWDDQGIVANFTPKTGVGDSIEFALALTSLPIRARDVFTHNIIIDGKMISAKSTPADLKAAGLQADPQLTMVWRQILGKCEVNVTTDEETKEIYTIAIEIPTAP